MDYKNALDGNSLSDGSYKDHDSGGQRGDNLTMPGYLPEKRRLERHNKIITDYFRKGLEYLATLSSNFYKNNFEEFAYR